MHGKETNRIFLVVDMVFFAAVITWLLTPLLKANAGITIRLIQIANSLSVFRAAAGVPASWLFPLAFLLYLIPVVFLFKLAEFFWEGKYPRIFRLNKYAVFTLNFVFSGLPLFFFILIITCVQISE